MPVREAEARWEDSLREGKGSIHGSSGAFDVAFTFRTRFESDPGTNPEELIGAAHAGCFSMALSGQLGKMSLTADSIETTATVTLDKTDAGFTITEVNLDVTARVPGASEEDFEKAAENAKIGCPVSRLLMTKITMDAKLVGAAAATE